jgi:uncharacterized protein YjlB
MTSRHLIPLKDLQTSTHFVPRHGFLPNSAPTNKALLVYHGAFSGASGDEIEAHLLSVGVCTPQWRYTLYPKTHYHSTSHELLIVVSGKAEILMGGEKNPKKVLLEVEQGDVLLLPAGMAHKIEREIDGGEKFEIMGAYPKGSEKWDMCYGEPEVEAELDTNETKIVNLGWIDRDPLYGDQGPALEL